MEDIKDIMEIEVPEASRIEGAADKKSCGCNCDCGCTGNTDGASNGYWAGLTLSRWQ